MVDAQSGRTYYVNRANGQTQWQPPPGFGGAPRGASPARGQSGQLQLGTGYEREMGGGSKSQASMSNIDLETTSMKLAATSSMKLGIVAVLVAATVAVVAFVALSEDDEAAIQAGPNGRAAGTSNAGGLVVVDPCADIDCNPGRCDSETVTCECPTGYTDGGDTCTECEPGYTLVGSLCENVDECLGNPCGDYVDRCTPADPPETDPTCTCITGYVFVDGACTLCPPHTTGANCELCLEGYQRGPVGGATCEPVDCHVPVVDGGTTEGDTYFGAATPLTVTCNSGYTMIGDGQLSCLATGQWPQLPICRHNYCSLDQLALTNADITGCAGDRCEVGTTITVSCTQAGMVQETETPSCTQSGGALPRWSSFIVTCGNVDPCIGVECGSEGTCVGGACECNDGYDGDTCADCAPGYTRRDASAECVNVDECAGTPHPCTDTVGPLPDSNHDCDEVVPPDTGTTPHCTCGVGYDLTNGVCRPTLETAVARRVATVVAMRDRARTAYESRCSTIELTCNGDSSNDHCTDDACNPSAAWNINQDCLHSDVFGTNNLCRDCVGAGRKMDAAHSTVTINKRLDRTSPAVKEAVCFSKGLDTEFQQNVASDAGIQFQWFASEAGPLRTFPGDARQLPSYDGDRPDDRGLDPASSMADENTAPWLTVNAASGERITDDMTCADCVAQGFQCGQCIKYGFECTNTCSGDTDNQQRLVQDAKYCNWNDPREESWYVSAVSGPKDVVIVVDLSASMSQCAGSGSTANCETRLDVAKVGVRKVLETLSERDYAQIIPFGQVGASCYDPSCSADCNLYNEADLCTSPNNKMLQMTSSNRALLEQYVTDMTIADGAGNSFRIGFRKAFDVLDRSVVDATAGCTKAVLFFTDGAGARKGSANPDTAEEVVRQYDATWTDVKTRNQVDVPTGATGPHQAHVFWFSVTRPSYELTDEDKANLHCQGQDDVCTPWHDLMSNTYLASLNGQRYNPPYAKKITCQNRGVFSHIRDPSMVEDALASYYQFLSRAAPSDTVRWSQIYTDESTGKEVVAGTLAVYTSGDDPVLVGVVGMTVLASSFDYGETERRNALLEMLADNEHSGNCVPRAHDLRTLERLRYTYGTRIDTTDRNNAHDQAYAADRAGFVAGITVEDAGYFSTCCMDDDRRGFPPGSDPAPESRYSRCTSPLNCAEQMQWITDSLDPQMFRPKNDWYDTEMCGTGSVPTVAEALIQTESSQVCAQASAIAENQAICTGAGPRCQESFSCCGGPGVAPGTCSSATCAGTIEAEATFADAVASATQGR